MLFSDKTHAVQPLSGETVRPRFVESANGSGDDQLVRRSWPRVPVAHVRHGSGRGTRLGHVVWCSDDRRVRMLGHT